jgi:hypothetical protein
MVLLPTGKGYAMSSTQVVRQVAFAEVGDRWVKYLIDVTSAEDVVAWVECNLAGRFSTRVPTASEVRERIGVDPAPDRDRRFLVVAFEEHRDAELFHLWRRQPAGHA